MKIGYARVSTDDQDPDLQLTALKRAGRRKIFTDKATGANVKRPELAKCLKAFKAGADFRSLTEVIDTTAPGGRMMMQIIGTFAEFERAMLRERTSSGLDAARKQGRVGGRRPKLKAHQQKEIIPLVTSGQRTAADVAMLFCIHPSTVSRLLQQSSRH
jgi:DNA invertase Pin-like site-specific DNA recombinase